METFQSVYNLLETTGWWLLLGGWAWFGLMHRIAERARYWGLPYYRSIFKLSVLLFIVVVIWRFSR